MRTKVTLVLLFLNVVLFFFIFKFERRWRTDSAALEARRRVLGAETANIQSIEITAAGPRPAVHLTRTPEGWQLTSPIVWPANPHAVNRIINDLALLEHESSFSVRETEQNGMSLADYDLAQPRLTVTFSSGDPTGPATGATTSSTTLRLGRDTPADGRLYVLSPDGQRIHVVGRSLADSLSQPLEELRSHAIFTTPVFEVRSFNLRTAPPANLRIRVRQEGNRWSFETPIGARASKTATVLTINKLNKLRVKAFVPQPPPGVAPATNPELRVTLEGNNRSETLFIGPPVPPPAGTEPAPGGDLDYYAMLEGKDSLFTVTIPTDLMKTLRAAQTDLRERRLLEFDPAVVSSISIAAPNAPELTLQRLESSALASETGQWQIIRRDTAQGPQTQPADREIVQRVLTELTELAALEFVHDAPPRAELESWGFNRPIRQITLTLTPPPSAAVALRPGEPTVVSQLTLEVGVGAEGSSTVYARVPPADFVYKVDADLLAETPPAPLYYRDRLVRDLPAGAQITALKLVDVGSGAILLETLLPDPATASSLQPLLTRLRTLRAQNFVEDSFTPMVRTSGEEHPWKYRLETTISLVGGATGAQTSTTTLFFTGRLGGTTQFAGSPDFSAVWELEQPFIDALWTVTHGARDPGPPTAAAAPGGTVP